MSVINHDCNDDTAQERSNQSVPRETFEIQIYGVMAITVYTVCLSSDFHEFAHGSDYAEFTQYAPFIGGESTLSQSINNLLLHGSAHYEDIWVFRNPLETTNPGQHDGFTNVPHHGGSLHHCRIVVAGPGFIGNEGGT